MKAQTVDVKVSTGRILCCTIFRPGGRKLLAKGHVLSEDDVRLLETEGLDQVWVTELEEGEVSEDEAVCQASREMACGAVECASTVGASKRTEASWGASPVSEAPSATASTEASAEAPSRRVVVDASDVPPW